MKIIFSSLLSAMAGICLVSGIAVLTGGEKKNVYT